MNPSVEDEYGMPNVTPMKQMQCLEQYTYVHGHILFNDPMGHIFNLQGFIRHNNIYAHLPSTW